MDASKISAGCVLRWQKCFFLRAICAAEQKQQVLISLFETHNRIVHGSWTLRGECFFTRMFARKLDYYLLTGIRSISWCPSDSTWMFRKNRHYETRSSDNTFADFWKNTVEKTNPERFCAVFSNRKQVPIVKRCSSRHLSPLRASLLQQTFSNFSKFSPRVVVRNVFWKYPRYLTWLASNKLL